LSPTNQITGLFCNSIFALWIILLRMMEEMKPTLFLFAVLCPVAIAQSKDVYLGPTVLPRIADSSAAHAAFEAYRSGEVSKALEMARPLADHGDGDACFLLGFSAEEGYSRSPSRLQAMAYYYQRAAAAGNAEAPLRDTLAAWEESSGDEKAKARQEIETAATQGNPRACRILGEAWMRGIPEGKPDPAKAREWWTKATEAGDLDSFVPLGKLLLGAGGSPRDEQAGYAWLEKATARHDANAWLVLGDDLDQVKKDSAAAVRDYRQGSDSGQTECMLRLAMHSFQDGKENEGREWLGKSADAGNADAGFELGGRLLRESPSNLPRAYHYLLSAARNGLWQAQYQVAMIQLEGRLGDRDPVSAAAWLMQAMPSEDPETLYKLASLNEEGLGVAVNYANATMLYNLASLKGHAGASARMARMAYEGLRLKKNNAQAWAYASLAVKRGHEASKALLSEIEAKLSPGDKTEGEKLFAQLMATPTDKAAKRE
jgi:TPR repeat protein